MAHNSVLSFHHPPHNCYTNRKLLCSSPWNTSKSNIFTTGIRRTTTRKLKVMSMASAPGVRPEVSLSTGAYVVPHPKKVETGGEDAFFVSNSGYGVLAIADGVSGWAERNVNPALFSQELMRNISSLMQNEEVNIDPVILLKKAHASTASKGSATVIVAMLDKSGVLKIANVGDCGLRVIRTGQVVFSTTPQEHYFDCPYQMSSETLTQTYRDALNAYFSRRTRRRPTLRCSVNLMEGDTIIMGSDGLFDNVFDSEIVSTLSNLKSAKEAAKALADLAHKNSQDSNFDSPYSMEARSRGYDVPAWKKILGQKLTGGKLDDITVIVGIVGGN